VNRKIMVPGTKSAIVDWLVFVTNIFSIFAAETRMSVAACEMRLIIFYSPTSGRATKLNRQSEKKIIIRPRHV